MNLLDRDPVTGRWFSYLNLEFGPRRDGFRQPLFFSAETPNAAAS
jgi:hypothetical protein